MNSMSVITVATTIIKYSPTPGEIKINHHTNVLFTLASITQYKMIVNKNVQNGKENWFKKTKQTSEPDSDMALC